MRQMATALKLKTQSYGLEVCNGYLIADIEGARCLIDTGSPVTIGDRPSFDLLGRKFETMRTYGPVSIEGLGKNVGCRLDFLLGLDALAAFPWDFDLDGKLLTFHPEGLPRSVTGNWTEMDCGSFLGAPILDFTLNGQKLRGILDTGAPTQYAPSWAELGPVDSVVDDFFPGVGWFKATHHRATFTIGDRTIVGGFGKFPADIPLAKWNMWILGHDVLKSGPMALDLRERRVYLC